MFTTKGDPLNKAEVQYLEARLVELATEHLRCRLNNANTPSRPGLSEADQAQVEGYLEEMLSLMPVLGVYAFEGAESIGENRVVYYLRTRDCDASGYETSSGFAVRAGSLARGSTVPSMQEHVPSDFYKRQQLIDDGVLIEEGASYRFRVDHEFSSPSQAGAVCSGRSTNGRVEWKDDKGVTLKEHQVREADA